MKKKPVVKVPSVILPTCAGTGTKKKTNFTSSSSDDEPRGKKTKRTQTITSSDDSLGVTKLSDHSITAHDDDDKAPGQISSDDSMRSYTQHDPTKPR